MKDREVLICGKLEKKYFKLLELEFITFVLMEPFS